MPFALFIGPAILFLIVASPLFTLAPRLAATVGLSLLPAVMLSRVFSPVRYYLRLTTFLLGLAANSAWGVIVSIALSLVGKSMNINWVVARSFRLSTAPLCGVTFKVEGKEHLEEARPAVLVGNHQTMIDILYLGAVFPKGASIMAKKELKWMPLLGQFMTLSNAVFVNRSKRQDAVAVFAKVAQTMKEKSLSLFIFPEGTRSASPTPSLLPFKKGAFHLAVQAQLPIVPIVCENYSGIYSSKHKRFDSGEIVVRVLPPISTVGITSSSEDITKLTDKTRLAMLEAIEDLGRKRQEQNRIEGKKVVDFGKKENVEPSGERQRLLNDEGAPAS